MLRALLILLLAIPGSVACGQLSSPSPTPEWYGAKIGDQVLPHTASPERALWPDYPTLPAPWTEASVETDEQGRVARLHFQDSPDIVVDAPRGYRPDTTSAIPHYFAEGSSIGRDLFTRFGKPTISTTDPYDGDRKWATLLWDFTPRFARCDGTTPVFEPDVREPSNMIAAVRLRYSPDGVELEIWGMMSRERTMRGPTATEERAAGIQRCNPQPPQRDPTRDLGKDVDDFCDKNPDKCITSIPGVTIIPVPGTTVVKVPCPRGSHHLACYKGAPTLPPPAQIPPD